MDGSVRVAFKAIGRNRLRSALTLLGITIGVAVVITMVAIGTGAQRSIERQVRAAGANMITVTAGNFSPGDLDPGSLEAGEPTGLAGGASLSDAPIPHKATVSKGAGWAGMSTSPRVPGRGASTRLSTDDAAALRQGVVGVHLVAAGVSDTAVVSFAATRAFVRVQGTEMALAEMRGLSLAEGRFLSASDVANASDVMVLSAPAAGRLFPVGTDPVGQTVTVRQRPFVVRGVLAPSSALSVRAGAMDEVFVPYTAAQRLLKIGHLHSIAVSIEQAGETTRTARDASLLLRQRHSLGANDPDDFTVKTESRDAINGKGVNPLVARAVAGSVVNLDQVTLAEIASSLERSSRVMTALLAGVASVSLLVGGIGIMNMMLVSVTERTREIGLRMAVGARGRDVLVQFLTEAVVLSSIGGLAGIAVGIGASGGVARLLRWATVITPGSIAIAVTVAAAVGVFFGFYPARQASRLDPIDALRYE